MQKPGEEHRSAVKRVLRYLRGTESFELDITTSSLDLSGYSDSDWAGDKIDWKSTSGSTFYLGNALVFWKSGKQDCVSAATAEAEYTALSEATKRAL